MGANQHTSKGRTVSYKLAFTRDEKRALDARAAAEGVTLADLIRASLGLAEAPTAHVPIVDPMAALLASPDIKAIHPTGTARGQHTRRK